MELGKVVVVVGADTAGLDKALAEINKALGESEKETQRFSGGVNSLWKQFAVGELAVSTLKKGLSVLVDTVKDCVASAAEQEAAEKAVAAAIDITDRKVPGLAAHFNQYAGELQGLTVYSDEAIGRAQALLLQLTKLDKDGIDKATRGAIGLASVLGMDLNAAATLVAKAMEGNTAALSRYGIRVDETLTPQEKQAAILQKLEAMYQRAEAETDTYTGRLKQFKNTLDDLKESAGNYIVKSQLIASSMSLLTKAIEAAQKPVNDLKKKIAENVAMEAEWAGSLKVLTPSIEEMGEAVSHGPAKWEAYKKKVEELDKALWANRDTIVGWIDKGARFLGLVDNQTQSIRDNEAAVRALGVKSQAVAEGELKILEQSILQLIKTGAVNVNVLGESAKKAADLADKYGLKLDPAVRKLADSTEKTAKATRELAGAIKQTVELAPTAIGAIRNIEYVTSELGVTALDTSKDLGADLWEAVVKVQDEAAAAAKKIEDAWGAAANIWGQAIAEIITDSESLEETIAKAGRAFAGAFAQMVAAAAGAAGPIAAAIGLIVGAIAKDFIPAVAQQQAAIKELQDEVAASIYATIAPLGEFSDATKAAYQKLVEEIGVAAATTQMLNQLMAESGVNADNIAQYWWDAAMVLEQFAAGEISASDAAGTLDDAFTTLLNAARSLGQEGSTDMVNFIVTAREMGLEIASVTQYVQQQLNTIPAALQSMVDGLGTSGQNIADMGTLAVATFQSMVDSGMSWGEALDAMGPTLAELKAKYEELGLAADPALQELMNIASVREENEALFDSIDANLQVMQALANTGYLTGEALGAIERNAKQYYDDLIAAGVSADDATRALVPTLQAIYDNHVKSGEPIDANTQALIDQAKALGLIEEATPDPGEVMASGMDRLAEILERIAFALGAGIPDAAEKGAARMESSMSGAADRISEKLARTAKTIGDNMGSAAEKAVGDWGDAAAAIDSSLARVSFNPGTALTADIPGYAGGGIAWGPQLATVAETEPEVIIPMSDYVSGKGLAANAGAGMGGGGTVVNLSIYAQTLDDNTIARASEKIYAAVEREQRRHGRG